MHYSTIDEMLSGTGIRNGIEGGYLEPKELGVSSELANRIAVWLSKYEEAHYDQFQSSSKVYALDEEGMKICVLLRQELADAKIEYFSSARMEGIPVPTSE